MTRVLLCVAALSASLTAAEQPLRIRTSMGFATPGGAVQVTCTVSKNERNRWLEIGVRNEQQSRRQLDGLAAVVTHQMWVKKISCQAGAAFCELTTNDDKVRKVEQPLRMIGCPDEDEAAGIGLPSQH